MSSLLKNLFANYFAEQQLAESDYKMAIADSLSSLLPYRIFDEDNLLFINNNSFGFILEATPLVGANSDTINLLTGMITDGVPTECTVQFINWASPNISTIIDDWQKLRKDKEREIYDFLSSKRRDYIKDANWNSLFNSSPYLIRNFRLFIAVSLPGILNKKNSAEILRLRQTIQTSLKTINIHTIITQPNDFIKFIAELVDPAPLYQREEIIYNPYDLIHLQITNPENSLTIESDYLQFNQSEIEVRCFTPRQYPEFWGQWDMADLIGDTMSDFLKIPCPFLISFAITLNDEAKEQSKAFFKASRATQQAGTGLARYMPSIYKKQRDWQFVVDKLNQGQKLVKTFYQIVLYAQKERMDHCEQVLRSLYKANGWLLAKDKFVQLQSFLACLPFNLSQGLADDLVRLGRSKNMISWTCANIAPLQGEYKGSLSPCMLLFGRRGQPFYWDPFYNQEGNYNVAVIGKSGSGKSVFMQDYVVSLLGKGGRIFVIDDGRSFMNSCLIQGGQFIEFSSTSKLCINPFSIISPSNFADNSTYRADVIKMINMIIRQMCRAVEKTSDIENAYIEKGVSYAWNLKQNNADISLVAKYLRDLDDPRAQDLAMMLSPYIDNGIYAHFFIGKANLFPDRQLTVFELAELKNKKDLQAIVMMLLMFLVSESMYHGGRKQNISLIIDEAWDLLHGEATGEFIEGLARRARKYNGNIVTGTQSMNDYYKNSAATAAIENTDWVCLLAQKKESIEQIRKMERLYMDEKMEEMLKSLRTVDRQYSEVMICGPSGYSIGRLLLDPYSIALYSSKGSDFNLVQKLLEQGCSLSEAITHLADNIINAKNINKG